MYVYKEDSNIKAVASRPLLWSETKLLLRLFESDVLSKFLRVLLKLNLALNFLSILGGVVHLSGFFVFYDNEVVLYF